MTVALHAAAVESAVVHTVLNAAVQALIARIAFAVALHTPALFIAVI